MLRIRRSTFAAATVTLLAVMSVACGQPSGPAEKSSGPAKKPSGPAKKPWGADSCHERRSTAAPEDGSFPGISFSELDILDADNVWAVGVFGSVVDDEKGPTQLARWDGRRWATFHPSPGLQPSAWPPPGAAVMDVAGPNDIWVARDTFICRWDGSTWETMIAPSASNFTTLPHDIEVVARNDAWMVGTAEGHNEKQGEEEPVASHWDGRRWSLVDTPDYGHDSSFGALAVVSSNDIWAIGWADDSPFGSRQKVRRYWPIAARWNGKTWRKVPLPALPDDSFLSDITAVAPDDVWAVGEAGGQALALRWNGRAWTDVSPRSAGLAGIASDGAGGMWATGNVGDEGGGFFLHWTNGRWQRVDPAGGDEIRLGDIALVPGSSTLWAIGSRGYAEATFFYRYESGQGWSER